jgi:C-terminal processing protease CtpA/Prc
LKGTNRAYFVGEETGGAYNGTVAAQMPLVTLPNSKVNMRVGLAVVAAFEKSDVEGRGVFPDKVIIPTVEDRIKKVDPELNWIIDDIKREKEVKQLLQENFNK